MSGLAGAQAWAAAHRKQLLVGGGAAVAGIALYQRRKANAGGGAGGAAAPSQETPVSYADPQSGVDTAGFGYLGVNEDLGAINRTLNKILGRLPGKPKSSIPTKPPRRKKPPKKKPPAHHHKPPRPTNHKRRLKTIYPVHGMPGGMFQPRAKRLPVRSPRPTPRRR